MKCICGEEKVTTSKRNGVPLGKCVSCGLIRQTHLPFSTEEEYVRFYRDEYPPVKTSYVAKDYDHDRNLAKLRLKEYDVSPGDRVLDVGSGSGAFVDECRCLGVEAYGCEISRYHYGRSEEFIYRGELEGIHFPTDHFDVVTCHDAMEHVLDPPKFVREMFRILKQKGVCIIDAPNFFVDAGKHHWKPVEHIWYFTTEQYIDLLINAGFMVSGDVRHPIESKSVFYTVKPEYSRPKILVPPGIGDSYWSIVKMQSFLEKEGVTLPDVHVVAPRDKAHDGHKRSFPFLEMFPFIHSPGKCVDTKSFPDGKALWKEAYGQQGRTIFRDVLKHDYFISYNGHLRFGKTLEGINPDIECNWFPPMFVSLEQERFKVECETKYGDYIVFYFVFHGTYRHWTKQFPVDQVISFVQNVTANTGCTPVFSGAIWDNEEETLSHVIKNVPGCVDLTGKTTLEQLFGLLRGTKGVIGYPSGLTIMSAMLKQQTMIIWNAYYNRDFAWYACPPSVREESYFVEFSSSPTEQLTAAATDVVLGKTAQLKSLPKQKKLTNVAVACVLKSGGDFTPDHVHRLQNMMERNVKDIEYKFVCLSDVPVDLDNGGINIHLRYDYSKWWSKVELFREDMVDAETIIYFDLDTVILKNIDDILAADFDFAALRPWNSANRRNGQCASGMMAWKNDGSYSFISEQFNFTDIGDYPHGDQQYISEALSEHGKFPQFLQDTVGGIYSYKRECRDRLPPDARIICFHGSPRPEEVKHDWMVANWK